MLDYRTLSVEAYDALVDAGKIKAWTGQEAKALSRQIQASRSRTGAPLKAGRVDASGELREACRKILAYKLKTPPSRKPRVKGVEGSGAAWRG